MVGFKTMLGRGSGKVGFQEGKEKPFKDFDSGGKEGDRTVGGALARRFSRFEERDNGGGFPNGWDVGVLEG